ncbi:unnamed protein product, partial [Nesidiocoris tenuis]
MSTVPTLIKLGHCTMIHDHTKDICTLKIITKKLEKKEKIHKTNHRRFTDKVSSHSFASYQRICTFSSINYITYKWGSINKRPIHINVAILLLLFILKYKKRKTFNAKRERTILVFTLSAL